MVRSPLHGTAPAAFYRNPAADTALSELHLNCIFTTAVDARRGALQLGYRWTMGEIVEFDCVDVFEFAGPPYPKPLYYL